MTAMSISEPVDNIYRLAEICPEEPFRKIV
jgi:hypothetical protein